MSRKSFNSKAKSNVINMVTNEPVEVSMREFLGQRIRYFRMKAGIQQQDLASAIGLAKASVCAWESGKTSPDVVHIPKICDVLRITPSQLYRRTDVFTQQEIDLVHDIRKLSGIEMNAVRTLIESLLEAKRLRHYQVPQLIRCKIAQATVAAGIGDFADWGNDLDDVYLHDNALAQKTDLVFKVNGDSMEPTFPNGCLVSVDTDTSMGLREGDIAVFQVEDSLYIKEYQRDGLHSHNEHYDPMLYKNYGTMITIGKVNGIIPDDDLASQDEVNLYLSLENE